jgi:nicotinamidase/pyrazinamidase
MALLHLEDVLVGEGDGLLIVDVQNDFLPGGRMPVPRAHRIIPALNRAIARFEQRGLPIFAARDWHRDDGAADHCVRGAPGSDFAPELDLPPATIVISRGGERHVGSAFRSSDLARRLRAGRVRHLFVGGIGTASSVLDTVRDALDHGFAVSLLVDAVAADNVHGDGHRAILEMLRLGATVVEAGPHHREPTPSLT